MTSQQQKAIQEVTELISPLPTDEKVGVLKQVLTGIYSNDLAKLSLNVEPALMAPSTGIKVAEQILSSFEIDKDEFVELVIPANVSDIDAMIALNFYYKEILPGEGFTCINEINFQWYAKQASVLNRDLTRERHIKINVLVDSTFCKTRSEQIEALKSQGLELAPPAEVALVVAACDIKENGGDLLGAQRTRTEAPHLALQSCLSRGLAMDRCHDEFTSPFIWASGVRLSRN